MGVLGRESWGENPRVRVLGESPEAVVLGRGPGVLVLGWEFRSENFVVGVLDRREFWEFCGRSPSTQ